MAVFDPSEQRVCVRVVYDGVAGAGKTTNLRQLQNLFAAQRATELYSPADLRGRTLFFDWMQIAAGFVCGYPLLCQVLSVPGQLALSERRRALVTSADVVVYVCESTAAGVAEAIAGLRSFDRLRRSDSAKVPVILQANKQDQRDALDEPALRRALRDALGERTITIVPAIATDGIGVVDTFVSAVRVVARALQASADEGALALPVRVAEGMHHVLERVAAAPIDLEGAAELLLEEASAAYLLGERVTPKESPAPAPETADAVPLPSADVPTGFIWPAHTGRSTLRALAESGALAGEVRVGPEGVTRAVGGHVLATSPAARFVEPDAAQQALVRAARERTQLDSILVGDTVLVLQPTSDGAAWLWTVTPRTEPLAAWLDEDPATRLEALALVVVEAASVTLRRGMSFEARLDAFGVQQGKVRYAARIAPTAAIADAASGLLFGTVADVEVNGYDADLFVDAVERELERKLAEDERARLAAAAAVPDEGACRRLYQAIRRVHAA